MADDDETGMEVLAKGDERESRAGVAARYGAAALLGAAAAHQPARTALDAAALHYAALKDTRPARSRFASKLMGLLTRRAEGVKLARPSLNLARLHAGRAGGILAAGALGGAGAYRIWRGGRDADGNQKDPVPRAVTGVVGGGLIYQGLRHLQDQAERRLITKSADAGPTGMGMESLAKRDDRESRPGVAARYGAAALGGIAAAQQPLRTALNHVARYHAGDESIPPLRSRFRSKVLGLLTQQAMDLKLVRPTISLGRLHARRVGAILAGGALGGASAYGVWRGGRDTHGKSKDPLARAVTGVVGGGLLYRGLVHLQDQAERHIVVKGADAMRTGTVMDVLCGRGVPLAKASSMRSKGE